MPARCAGWNAHNPTASGPCCRPAEVFAAFANGVRDQGVVLASDDHCTRSPDLRPGGIVLYGSNVKDELGHRIEFTDDPKPGTAKIKCSRIEITFGAHRLIIDKDMGVDGPV